MMTSSWGLDGDVAAGHRGALPDRPRGVIGVPVPGVELKLAPVEGKLEMRVKDRTSPRATRPARPDGEGVRRGRLVPHRRRGQARGPGRPEPRRRVRRARGRGLQAAHGHVRVGRHPARPRARGHVAAVDGRRGVRARPRLCRAARLAEPGAAREIAGEPEGELDALVQSPKVHAFVRDACRPTTPSTRRPRPGWSAWSCSRSPRRWTPTRSPTRATSTSAPRSSGAARSSPGCSRRVPVRR